MITAEELYRAITIPIRFLVDLGRASQSWYLTPDITWFNIFMTFLVGGVLWYGIQVILASKAKGD